MWRKVAVLATFGGLVVGGSAAARVHTVRPGETLGGISRTYGVPVPALAAANGLADPDRVIAGSTLVIPTPGPPAAPIPARATGAVHTVRAGETLAAISQAYGVSPSALAAANGLRDPNRIVAGSSLVIPGPGPAAAAPVPTAGALQDKVLPMPAATLAAARTGPKIVVPADRAGLRVVFLRFSRLAGIPSDLAMALAWQESGWQRNRVSSTNAVGVMQLMPDTVDFVSGQLLGTARLNPYDPVANIRMGTRFVRYLLDSHGGDVDLALASYYQGLRSVKSHGTLDETDRFVANVKALRGRL